MQITFHQFLNNICFVQKILVNSHTVLEFKMAPKSTSSNLVFFRPILVFFLPNLQEISFSKVFFDNLYRCEGYLYTRGHLGVAER